MGPQKCTPGYVRSVSRAEVARWVAALRRHQIFKNRPIALGGQRRDRARDRVRTVKLHGVSLRWMDGCEYTGG